MKCPHCNHEIKKVPLTLKMQKVFNFIDMYIKEKNEAPSYDEIMDHFSTTKSNVARYILNLQERGWVAKEMYKARTLKIL